MISPVSLNNFTVPFISNRFACRFQIYTISFSYSEGCLLALLIVSLTVKMLLSLLKSHLFISVFASVILGSGSQRIFAVIYVKKMIYQCSSLRVLQFLGLNLGVYSIFSLFLCGVRKCSNFILLYIAAQFSQHHLLKRLSFPVAQSCLLC